MKQPLPQAVHTKLPQNADDPSRAVRFFPWDPGVPLRNLLIPSRLLSAWETHSPFPVGGRAAASSVSAAQVAGSAQFSSVHR